MRVVGIRVDAADHAPRVDHDAGRERELPGIVAVVGGEVDAEAAVDVTQVVGQCEGQPEAACPGVAGIAEDGELEMMTILDLGVLRGDRGRDRDQVGSERAELAEVLLQSIQLRVAVRSPEAAVDGDDERALRQ